MHDHLHMGPYGNTRSTWIILNKLGRIRILQNHTGPHRTKGQGPIRTTWDHIRDGILRERREHARGRNLADCGRICGSPRKSFGSIEEMWKKYSK